MDTLVRVFIEDLATHLAYDLEVSDGSLCRTFVTLADARGSTDLYEHTEEEALALREVIDTSIDSVIATVGATSGTMLLPPALARELAARLLELADEVEAVRF
jgi:hypothetical protein